MNETPPELEERFSGVTVIAILLPGVIDVLSGPGIFQLKGRYGKTVYGEHHVHGLVRLADRVVNLSGDGEDI
jgi:hypothetical protein